MFWGDYARDTGHLNATMHGAYLMLIKHYWCSGEPLPDDDDVLWRIACCDSKAEWRKIRRTVGKFFQIGDGLWRHGRIDAELDKARENVEKRSKAGAKGAQSRWQSDANANGNRTETASRPQWQNDGTSTPSSNEERETRARARDPAPLRTAIPPDFWPAPEILMWAALQKITDAELAKHVETFIAHYRHTGELSADWDAAFKKWLIRSPQFDRERPGGGKTGGDRPRPGSPLDAASRVIARRQGAAGL